MEPDTNNACIVVDGLVKTYRRGKVKALSDISLMINTGEVFGLIGPNGAGKTTLMQCLIGVIHPTRGRITIAGLEPDKIKVKEQLAFLPERPAFDGWMTARQFLRYQYMLAKKPFSNWKQSVEEALDLVRLEEAARNRKITQFSRGMLQRIGLAQMLVGDPKICFLDEPTSGMDPLGMQLVRDLLVRWKNNGVTVVLNSHHLDEVERVCDRVAFIKAGTIETIESISEINMQQIRVLVRWQDNGAPESDVLELLRRVETALQVVLLSHDDREARFALTDNAEKPLLIKALVEEGVAVEEVITEKKALVDIFIERVQERSSGDGTTNGN